MTVFTMNVLLEICYSKADGLWTYCKLPKLAADGVAGAPDLQDLIDRTVQATS